MNPAALTLLAKRALQVLALIAIWWASDVVVRKVGLPLPGGVVGLFVVLALLFSGWLPLERIELGARWLLAEMLVFFIPAVVAMARYEDLLRSMGLKLLVVIVVGNAAVMLVTALAVERLGRRRRVTTP
jgi:holin-like protein